MAEENPPQMSPEECRQIYEGIFSKHGISPDSLEQLGDFKNKTVQEVCEAGPEVFIQWIEDNESVHNALRYDYKNIQGPDEIASKGAAVWNCWQFNEHKHDLAGREIILHNMRHRNFRGFYFYQPIKCTGDIGELVNFRYAVFREAINFYGVTFREGVDFYGAKFIKFSSFLRQV